MAGGKEAPRLLLENTAHLDIIIFACLKKVKLTFTALFINEKLRKITSILQKNAPLKITRGASAF